MIILYNNQASSQAQQGYHQKLETKWVRLANNTNVRKSTSLIKSFNTEITTEPRKRGGWSAWLTEASYANETFVH